jgi:iron complex transport system permease protein
MKHTHLIFLGLIFISSTAILTGLVSGSVNIDIQQLWYLLTESNSPGLSTLIMELRLPRVLSAFAVGGLLSVSGVLMQVLLRNPLAEPYILGSSGGAAVAALLAMSFGLGAFWVDTAAFTGALCATFLVFGIASSSGNWGPSQLILTGVVLASGFSAVTTMILAISSEQNIRGMLFWMMGDLSFAYSPQHLLWLLIIIVLITMAAARYLDILSRGELQASILGIRVNTFRIAIFSITALATALSVTAVGVIGFIGLVVPHTVRLIVGNKHRFVVPASAMLGGSLLVISDTLARTILAPRQLPVGAITALIGVPLFLILMQKSIAKINSA